MPTIKYRVNLSPAERARLEQMLANGRLDRRASMHVRVLLLADEQRPGKKMSEQAIARELGINSQTVHTIRRRYSLLGLEAAINRKLRSKTSNGMRITPDVRTQIIALSQTVPPVGKSRWTLRLLAHHAIAQHIVDRISHETVGQVLKNAGQQSII